MNIMDLRKPVAMILQGAQQDMESGIHLTIILSERHLRVMGKYRACYEESASQQLLSMDEVVNN